MATSVDPVDFPAPNAEAAAASARLRAIISDEMTLNGGTVSFARFMELALYAPEVGYYRGGNRMLGADGDFITAPMMGSLLARCLARNIAPVLHALADGDLLEAGGGEGSLAAALLLALEQLQQLPRRYAILELSGELRARQRATIAARAGHLLDRVIWLDEIPDSTRGVVVANELLDAMPVRRFALKGGAIGEWHVANEHGRFVWRLKPPAAELAAAAEARLRPLGLPDGYSSEINFTAEAWVRTVAERLDAGAMLLIDYGYPRREYYHHERRDGTLTCHYRQRVHHDPLTLVGLQDITTHIDFTAIAEAAHGTGLDILGYTSQGQFLLASGITDLAAHAEPKTRAELAQEIKKLTLPHEMGEIVKVFAAGRGMMAGLPGFSLNDRRGRL